MLDAELVPFTSAAGGMPIMAWVRNGTQDFNTLYSCISEDEYQLCDVLKPGDRFIDVGAHVGGASLLALALGCEVDCVEALPENVAALEANLAANRGFLGHAKVWHNAISSCSDTIMPIYYGDVFTESGKVHEFIGYPANGEISDTIRRYDATTVTLNKVIESSELPVAMLKIDCEGSEWAAFDALTYQGASKIRRIHAELHATSHTFGVDLPALLQDVLNVGRTARWAVDILGGPFPHPESICMVKAVRT